MTQQRHVHHQKAAALLKHQRLRGPGDEAYLEIVAHVLLAVRIARALVPAASLGVTLDHRVDRGVHVGDLGHRCRVREQCRTLHKDGNRQI